MDAGSVLRAAAVESVWTGLHVALWPFGFLAERAEPRAFSFTDLTPRQRSLLLVEGTAASTPVLLVHGVIDNRSIFAVLRRELRRRGFEQVLTMNYSLLTNDVRTAAERLAEAVERVCAETGYSRIRLVGHSLGGLVARYYVQRMAGDARVESLITLGTPHTGTHLARLLPVVRLVRQLRPGSSIMTELAGPAPGCQTRMVALYSPLDEIVVPGRHARIDHPDLITENIEIPAVGHQSMPIDPRVLRAVVAALGGRRPEVPRPRPAVEGRLLGQEQNAR